MSIMVSRLASELGMDRSSLLKWLKRNNYTLTPVTGPQTRGQEALALSDEDADAVRIARHEWGQTAEARKLECVNGPSDSGVFYIIQLVPEYNPCRVKLGYAINAASRLADHRCAAPTAQVVQTFPCKRCWEQCATESITRTGCLQIGTEVFDCDDLQALIARAAAFFALMPPLNSHVDEVP